MRKMKIDAIPALKRNPDVFTKSNQKHKRYFACDLNW
jgi:hypothetical protein